MLITWLTTVDFRDGTTSLSLVLKTQTTHSPAVFNKITQSGKKGGGGANSPKRQTCSFTEVALNLLINLCSDALKPLCIKDHDVSWRCYQESDVLLTTTAWTEVPGSAHI